jgi:uncharacterized protein (TIRG00374 family)
MAVEQPVDELVREELDRAEKKRRTGRARTIGIVVSAVVIGVVFALVLPKIASYRDIWEVLQGLSTEWILALAGATVLNVVTFAPPWMAALPGLGFLHALRVTQASSALSTVAPGGAAVGMATSFAMLKRWGFEGRPVGLAVAVTGIWNQLAVFGFPAIALVMLAAAGGSSKRLELVALISLAALATIATGFALGLSSSRLAHRVGDLAARIVSCLKHLVRRRPVTWGGEGFARFRSEAIGLLRRRWHVLTAATLAGHLTVFLLLMVSLRAVGVTREEVTIVEAFAAWAIMRVIGSIPITPGGFGIIELGLTGLLVGFGGANAEVVAGVLLYRFLQVVPTLVLGMLVAATWKLHQPRPRSAG